MEHQDIRQLAQLMKEMELSALELKEGAFSIRMERGSKNQDSVPVPSFAETAAAQATPQKEPDKDIHTVTAPMIGVFYASSSPDMKPFVSMGDTVRAGDVLCIIEAMKMMNEITAETSGVVTEICVGNKQIVDYGHPLFRLRSVEPAAETTAGE